LQCGAIVDYIDSTTRLEGAMSTEKKSKKRITLDDVARLARVSPITVSRALRDPDKVSAVLRNRIDGAVMRLGYVPNVAASRLASARSHTIGVIVPTLYNVIFAEYLQAIHEVFLPVGFQVLVLNSRYSQQEEESAIRTLLGQRVEAIIIVGVNHTPLARRLLEQSRIPVIETFQISQQPVGINIGLDQVAAGHAATATLLGFGYRRVGFFMGQRDERAVERLSGYTRAMTDAGLGDRIQVVSVDRPSSIALGARLMSSLVDRQEVPEALFCIDDNLALGALQECRRIGLRVPADIAIVGFHDLEFSAFSSPSLSSVATRRYEMGKLAAERVLRLLSTALPVTEETVDLGYDVVLRQSTPARLA
jgi:LacI family gluconate utilization system Gnt-I transcriptional repressor